MAIVLRIKEGSLNSNLLTTVPIRKGGTGGTTKDQAIYNLGVYPIGSIYMSMDDTSPASLFGGTWQMIKDKFLLSAGDSYEVGSTGGSADAILVQHNHDNIYYSTSQREIGWKAGAGGTATGGVGIEDTAGDGSVYNLRTSETGESGVGKNMPPYLTVYVWERIE